jgi:hypothetical protein
MKRKERAESFRKIYLKAEKNTKRKDDSTMGEVDLENQIVKLLRSAPRKAP